ncbi:MAG: hypothetical protein L0210_10870 [Rhodospirillales bacterium]|nr:hypothetical protein [Rhodospirillales bacterium]
MGYAIRRKKGRITVTLQPRTIAFGLLGKLKRILPWMEAGEADARDLRSTIRGWRNGFKLADTAKLLFDLLNLLALATRHIPTRAALLAESTAVLTEMRIAFAEAIA